MSAHHSDPWLTIHGGDCRDVLPTLPERSVHMVCTSPPYWGLRDYGAPGQLGLEPTPEAYVEALVGVFREVRRVLRDDGTLWLNLGDAYAHQSSGGGGAVDIRTDGRRTTPGDQVRGRMGGVNTLASGLKPKDLAGIPWRVAFALQADGWYLRSDIIWAKPNPMPESVTDRPTKSHEHVFLLAKSARYFWDADAVREAWADDREGWSGYYERGDVGKRRCGDGTFRQDGGVTQKPSTSGRNIRDVWTIATQPYPGAHFATFPETLVEPCVKAGTSERGVCPECGAPWQRVVERTGPTTREKLSERGASHYAAGQPQQAQGLDHAGHHANSRVAITTGWHPGCAHDLPPVPALVLDCFAGSGTIGRVANRLSRRALLIELSPDYIDQALVRNADMPLGLEAVS